MLDRVLSVREMTVPDLPEVKRVDALSFSDWFRRDRGSDFNLPPRSDQGLLYYMAANPSGCLVLEDRVGQIVGCSISHLWGRIGWFGPLSVVPSMQGRGGGKLLIRETVQRLIDRGAQVVGLETMPQSVFNLGMYINQGFIPDRMELRYISEIKPIQLRLETEHPRLRIELPVSEMEILAAAREVSVLSQAIEPGLDYGPEVYLAFRFRLGRVLLLRSGMGRLVGFSILHMTPLRLEAQTSVVKAAGIAPEFSEPGIFEFFRQAWEQVSVLEGRRYLAIPVFTRHEQAVRLLAGAGYRVDYSLVRMFHREYYPNLLGQQNVFHFSAWAG